MNIVEIIKKAPNDHVYWCTLCGECKVEIDNCELAKFPILVLPINYWLTRDGHSPHEYPDAECILFPSKDNRDWAAFERELDTKEENNAADFYKGKKLFTDEDFNFVGSIKFPNTFDRPMMAAVICAGLLAGGCKDKGAALINKAVNYADMILEYTKEESNE